MKTKILPNIFISVGVLFALTRLLAGGTPQPTLITFDPPGSIDTVPMGINPAGVITGFYVDATTGFAEHGFLRAIDGTITTFDIPAAVFFTNPTGINPAGAITGNYSDAVTGHGFLRAPDGTITTFDFPGSGITLPIGINPSGTITGDYCDATFTVCHGFVRSPQGTFTSFDPSFILNLSGIINPQGAVVGYYFTDNGQAHGLLRDPNGTITTFDVPGACQTGNGTTFATGINPAGVVVGTYLGPDCLNFHGFVRSRDGTFTTFDFPGADLTTPSVINPAGAIAGTYLKGSEGFSFLRTPSGSFISFSTPGPGGPSAINTASVITGSWSEPQNPDVSHGFVWTP